jgi:hypothetical protein
MLYGLQHEWFGREVISERIREVVKDRLVRISGPGKRGLPLKQRVGRVLVHLGCSLQGEACRG